MPAVGGGWVRRGNSNCLLCQPAKPVRIPTQALHSPLWADPILGGDFLGAEIGLLAHEARHNEGKPHFCGTYDLTVDELGAHGVQADLHVWLALYSGSFLDGVVRSVHRASELRNAAGIFAYAFCNEPKTDVTVSVAPSAQRVVAGGTFSLAVTATNAGPGSSPQTYVRSE